MADYGNPSTSCVPHIFLSKQSAPKCGHNHFPAFVALPIFWPEFPSYRPGLALGGLDSDLLVWVFLFQRLLSSLPGTGKAGGG